MHKKWDGCRRTFRFDYKLPLFLKEHISGEIIVQDREATIPNQ